MRAKIVNCRELWYFSCAYIPNPVQICGVYWEVTVKRGHLYKYGMYERPLPCTHPVNINSFRPLQNRNAEYEIFETLNQY